MPRARNIKPGFFANEDLAELPFETRLLFIGLWTLADREGRLEDRPKRIKMAIFPGDDVNVEKCLAALDKAGFIYRYTVDGGRYIEVCQFKKHQNPHHREPDSTIPKPWASPRLDGVGNGTKPEALAPCKDEEARGKPEADTGQASVEPRSSPADSLIPDSGFLIRDITTDLRSLSGKPDADPPEVEPKGERKRRLNADAVAVLDFLNRATGSRFQPVEANLSMIRARLAEADIGTCKRVIASRWDAWADDPKMAEYLRPATLFAARNFANYAGQLPALTDESDAVQAPIFEDETL